MKALEKAKIALRKHLQENKDKVKADLERLREISNGTDVFSYLENLSEALSMEKIEVLNNDSIGSAFDDLKIDTYGAIDEFNTLYEWMPPDNVLNDYNNKSSEILSELFFYLHLDYGRSKKCSIFF